MPLRPRKEIKDLSACAHGGVNSAELEALGLAPNGVIDFSVCTNPFPPPWLKQVLSNANVGEYPDSETTEFRQKLSGKLGVSPNNIIAGSGTMELIRLVALAYFRPGDNVLIVKPTFGEYEVATRIAGARVNESWTPLGKEFPAQLVTDSIQSIRPRAVFICNPSNPTGTYLLREAAEHLLRAHKNTLIVLDEAYLSFVDHPWSSLDLVAQGNLIVLRSMTKDYGLAGLRLGYAVASEDVIQNLRRVCPPWNVNTVAQKAGVAALDHPEYLTESCKKIKEAKRFLVDELHRLGWQPLDSDTHYFLLPVGNAPAFRSALLKKGFLVRDCTSFDLPEYVRIAPRTMPECRKLIAAIRLLVKDGGLDA